MESAQIIGYGIRIDDQGRVLLLRRRGSAPPWPGRWWLPGDVTPREEEPDDTVPRVFRDLLRQEITAGYAGTVTGNDPDSGRHVVHNAYRVLEAEPIPDQPDDEGNPFDAMEWYRPEAALSELPPEQAALLRAALEHPELGTEAEPIPPLDALFEQQQPPRPEHELPERLSPREMALAEYAFWVGARASVDVLEEAMFEVLSEGVPKDEVARMREFLDELRGGEAAGPA